MQKEILIKSLVLMIKEARLPGLGDGKHVFACDADVTDNYHIHYLPDRKEFRIRYIHAIAGKEVYVPYHAVSMYQEAAGDAKFLATMDVRKKRGILTPYDDVPPDMYGKAKKVEVVDEPIGGATAEDGYKAVKAIKESKVAVAPKLEEPKVVEVVEEDEVLVTAVKKRPANYGKPKAKKPSSK